MLLKWAGRASLCHKIWRESFYCST